LRTSQRLLEKRNDYYDELNHAQRGDVDVTRWVVWFVAQVRAAWEDAAKVVEASLDKARFWTAHEGYPISERQRKAVNAMLNQGAGNFEGGMSARKYASIAGVSKPTATRDLVELERHGVLKQVGSGRSTRYYVNLPGWLP